MAYREYITDATPEWLGLPKGKSQGKIGAQFGNMVMSTPNARHMKVPLYGYDITVLLRTDFKFALPDPVCGPQPWQNKLAHLACMLAPTMEPEFSHLFRPFLDKWWTPLPQNASLGKLDAEIALVLTRKGNAWVKEIKQLVEDIKRGVHAGSITLEDIDLKEFEQTSWRLQRLWKTLRRPATLEELKWRYVNAQRLELNIRSKVKYSIKYRRLLQNPPDVPLPTSNTLVGAMTTHFPTAQKLHQVGLPVWYVYQASAADSTRFESFLTAEDVESMSRAQEIPPYVHRMGSVEGFVPDAAFLTGGDIPFISRKPVTGAYPLWRGKASDPARFSVMTAVLSRFRPGFYNPAEEIDANFASSPHMHDPTPPHSPPPASPLALPPPLADDPLPTSLQQSGPSTSSVASTSSVNQPSTSLATESVVNTRLSSSRGRGCSKSKPSRQRQQSSRRPPTPESPTMLPSGHKRPAEDSVTASIPQVPKKPRLTKSKGPAEREKKAPPPPQRSRFDDVVNRLMPQGLNRWQSILKSCQGSRTGREPPTFKGVKAIHCWNTFPDAATVSSLQNERNQGEYMISFARLLPTLQWRADAIENAETDTLGIHPQVWREVLGAWQTREEGSESANRRKQIMDALSQSASLAGLPSTNLNLRAMFKQPVLWNGVEILSAGASSTLPPEPVCREMLWYMCEVNFRLEFLALDYWVYDRTTSHSSKDSTQEPLSAIDRRLQVMEGISYWDGSVYPERIEDGGFTSTELEVSTKALYGMYSAMSCWSGKASPSQRLRNTADTVKLILSTQGDALNDNAVSMFENLVIQHYIETFLQVFARPPTLPRILHSPT